MDKYTAKKSVVFFVVMFAAVISLSLTKADIAVAGEINSSEQKVINAVSASFSFDGNIYMVKSPYIAQIKSKLGEDGVELSESNAQTYIAQYKNSYEELIEEGYCNKAGGSSSKDENNSNNGQEKTEGNKTDSGAEDEPDKADDAGISPKHSEEEKKRNKLFIRTILGKPQGGDSDTDETESKKNSGEKSSESLDKSADKADDSGIDWEKEQDTGSDFLFSVADTYAAQQKRIVIKSVDNKYSMTLNEDGKLCEYNGEKNLDKNPIDWILHIGQFKTLSYIIFGFSLFTVAAILLYILTVKGRSDKKVILRRILAVFSGLSMAGCVLMLISVFGMNFGLYNKGALHRHLMESDYYSGIIQMVRELTSETLNDAGLSADDVDYVFSVPDIYKSDKQYIDDLLSGVGDNDIDTENIEKKLEEKLAKASLSEREEVTGEVTDIYKDVIWFGVGNAVKSSMDGFRPWRNMVVIAGLLMLLCLCLFTFLMYGYLHKAAGVGMVSVFVPSALVMAGAIVLHFRGRSAKIVTEPVYYGQFMQKYINWSCDAFIYISFIGMLVALALFILKRNLRRIYV